MKCLVTGGAGFIGSHLVERLIAEGHQVTVLDDLSSGRYENLVRIKSKRLTFVKVDISSSVNKIRGYFKAIDWVFHLAAKADIVPSLVHPDKYYKANVAGTLNVLEAAKIASVKRFIYASSSSCYGIASIYPTPETAEIVPQHPYALTKYLAELYTLYWGKFYQLPVVILRLFNVYGERARTTGAYGAVLGVFLAQKLHHKPFTVVGDGSQKRDFVYVADVVEALISSTMSRVVNEIFNVGSGKPQTITTLIKLLGEGKIVYLPKRGGEPDCTWADISKIKKTLFWQPKVSFRQGIKRVLQNLDYFQDAPIWTAAKIRLATKEWFRYYG